MNSTRLALLGASLLPLVPACQTAPDGRASQPVALAAAHEPARGSVDLPMVVEETGGWRVRPGEYSRPVADGRAAVVLEGRRGITLDLSGVALRGSPAGARRDEARGTAILLRDCSDVTVRGGRIAGYRAGLVLENCRGVVVEGLVVEDGFAQALQSWPPASGAPAESLALAVARGEVWLERYGAGIAVIDCSEVTLRDCRVRRAQNGMLLIRSETSAVYDCRLAFLSGWGIALCRVDACTVSYNRMDYCARTPAEASGARAAGAAGVLLSGRCVANTLAFNRIERCDVGVRIAPGSVGDARSALADRAEDNLWYGNAIRASAGPAFLVRDVLDERLIENRVDTGLELHAARRVRVAQNRVEGVLGAGIAIVDGEGCTIAGNVLADCDTGLELRGGAGTESAQASDGHVVLDNRFHENGLDLVLERAAQVAFAGNRFRGSGGGADLAELTVVGAGEDDPRAHLTGPDGSLPSGRALQSTVRPLPEAARELRGEVAAEGPPEVPGGAGGASERWLAEGGELTELVLGPFGPWDFESGEPRPVPPPPGGLLGGIAWQAIWFAWDTACDPRGDIDAWRARRFQALERGTVRRWTDPWGGAERRARVGEELFGLLARTELEVAGAGAYRLVVTCDDGLRVLVDGEVVFEDWTWHPARSDSVEFALASGSHEVSVEYFQIEGAAALSVALFPVSDDGDPGHDAGRLPVPAE